MPSLSLRRGRGFFLGMLRGMTLEVVDERWLADAIAGLPGSDLSSKPDWGAVILGVGGKQFGRFGTDSSGRRILTLKGEPLENEALRQEFTEIVPGYYSNKRHWNSVLLDELSFSTDRLKEMVAESYSLVFASLTRAQREEVLGG